MNVTVFKKGGNFEKRDIQVGTESRLGKLFPPRMVGNFPAPSNYRGDDTSFLEVLSQELGLQDIVFFIVDVDVIDSRGAEDTRFVGGPHGTDFNQDEW